MTDRPPLEVAVCGSQREADESRPVCSRGESNGRDTKAATPEVQKLPEGTHLVSSESGRLTPIVLLHL